MNPPLRLGLRHPLHPMGARLELQLGKNILPLDRGDDLLETTPLRLGGGDGLHLPAVLLGKAGVHAEQVTGKEGRLVPAGTGADLQDDVAAVVGVPGEEQQAYLGVKTILLLLQ